MHLILLLHLVIILAVPCHFCLVGWENLNNMQLCSNQIILRTHTTMRQAIENQLNQEKSIHLLNNFFWEFR